MQVVDEDPPVVVFMDESTGAEAVRPLGVETLMHVIEGVTTARIEGGPLALDGVVIPEATFDVLLVGLGQLTGRCLG